jgi:hypothetical protein
LRRLAEGPRHAIATWHLTVTVGTGLVVEEKSWEGTNTPAAGWFVEPISRFQFS